MFQSMTTAICMEGFSLDSIKLVGKKSNGMNQNEILRSGSYVDEKDAESTKRSSYLVAVYWTTLLTAQAKAVLCQTGGMISEILSE